MHKVVYILFILYIIDISKLNIIERLIMRTFVFNTGVKVSYITPLIKGHIISSNGVILIPFDCDDVPLDSTLMFCADNTNLAQNGLIYRKMHNTVMTSKYAFFKLNK